MGEKNLNAEFNQKCNICGKVHAKNEICPKLLELVNIGVNNMSKQITRPHNKVKQPSKKQPNQQSQQSKQEVDTEKRTCYACGQVHEKDQICPKVLNNVRKYLDSNKSSCFWGNVFVQCIKKKKNFLQLLCEISELTKVSMTPKCIPNNIDLALDYCTYFLNCDIKALTKSQSELSNFFYDRFKDGIYCESEGLDCADLENHTYQLSMECSVDNFFDEIPECMRNKHYTILNESKELQLEVEKEIKNSQTIYTLFIRLPKTIGNSCRERVLFMDMNSFAYGRIKLCSDIDGKLKDLYEENSTFDYDELVEDLPCIDPKFTYWKKRILTACNNNLARWTREKLVRDGYAYKTIYKEWDVCLCVWNNNSSYSLTVTKNGMGYKFKCENTEEETRYRAMAKIHEAVHQSWKNRSTLHFYNKMLSASKTKHISHKDVIITSNTLACKSHSVIPYRGIVHILTPDFKEETYELYVSYCEDCRTYRAFSSDYEELLKRGKPLCKVFKSEKEYNQNKNNLYTYKSHSVLNTMGYTVKANSGLSTAERRNILLKAISNKLLTTDEVISFLNWLITSRRERPSYETAVDKWTSDMLFLKNYKSKNRKSIKVDSIRV